jgi:hypothetical protein
MGQLVHSCTSRKFALSCISRISPVSWGAAVAGIWLLPVGGVVVLAALAIAGTTAGAVRATHDHSVDLLISALLATRPRPQEHRLRAVR